jgi:hypothetical protein
MFSFVETNLFSRLVYNYLPDEEYQRIQLTLIRNPDTGAVIQGSGGVRKLRWKARIEILAMKSWKVCLNSSAAKQAGSLMFRRCAKSAVKSVSRNHTSRHCWEFRCERCRIGSKAGAHPQVLRARSCLLLKGILKPCLTLPEFHYLK